LAALRISVVSTARDLREFVDLAYRLNAADPAWVPPLRADMRARLSREKNPFFEHGEADYFLARRGGEVVGRIAAVANRCHDETHRDGVAFFGFFECIDDPEVAAGLFEEAGEWARERGYQTLRGPASFSVNDECGLLVDGFDTPPTMMMAHNPPYYAGLVEACGFAKAKDLWAFGGGDPERRTTAPERSIRAADVLRRRLGLTLRPFDPRDFDAEVARIQEIYNAIWERNWGFVPMTPNEIRHLARQFKPIYNPDIIPFVEKDGRAIGFGLALPDVNAVLRRHRSGRLIPAVPHLLWALWRKRIHRARIPMLGVLPEYRGKGIDALLWQWIWSHAMEHELWWGEAGWILEDNPAMANAAERMGFRRYKTYRMYDRAL
jgi:GNAT superfamily N-acetyltransferase